MRRRFVRIWRLVPLLAAVLVLAGCLKLDADLTIGTDDTVTGTYVVAYKKDPKQKEQPGLQAARPLLVHSGSADVRPYDDGQYSGAQYELRGVPFADLAAFTAVTVQGRQTGTIQLTRDGDDVLVAGTFDFRETSSANRTAEQDAEARRLFSVRIRLTFPGDVQTSNGAIDGRAVTWDIPPFVRTNLQARAAAVPPVAAAAATGGGGSADAARYTLWGGIGLAGLALVLGLVLLVRRTRRVEPAPVGPELPEASDFAWVLGDRTGGSRAEPADRSEPRDWARPPAPPISDRGPWDRTVARTPTAQAGLGTSPAPGAPAGLGTSAAPGAPGAPAGLPRRRGLHGPADPGGPGWIGGSGGPGRADGTGGSGGPGGTGGSGPGGSRPAGGGAGGAGRGQGAWPGTAPGEWARPANGAPGGPPFREPPRPDDPAGRP